LNSVKSMTQASTFISYLKTLTSPKYSFVCWEKFDLARDIMQATNLV
jgi:hypothetical protein